MKGVRWGRVDVSSQPEKVIVIGSGPSLKGFNFSQLKSSDAFIITVNGSGDYVPFADAWFTLDPWGLNGPQLPKDFQGKKYAAVPEDFGTAKARTPSHRIEAPEDITYLHRLISHNNPKVSSESAYMLELAEDTSCIHTGNSGFGAFNIAYHLRPKKILLLGIDANIGYFYSSKQANRPLFNLKKQFESSILQLTLNQIQVINGSKESKITCFPRFSPMEGLEVLNA